MALSQARLDPGAQHPKDLQDLGIGLISAIKT